MKLTAPLRLTLTADQHELLRRTVICANEACNFISQAAWDNQTFGQLQLHKLTYYAAKERFGLSAQVVVRCISKVADAYRLGKDAPRTFRPLGAIAYDERILTYALTAETASIWTLDGRLKVPFTCGPRQRELLASQQGESDLCLVHGQFFLNAMCNVEEPEPDDIDGLLGVDLGTKELAGSSSPVLRCQPCASAVKPTATPFRPKARNRPTTT